MIIIWFFGGVYAIKLVLFFCRTMGWSPLWNLRFCLMVNMGLTEISKWLRKFGLRCSSTLPRTMSCSKVSSSNPAWSLLVQSARTGPHQSRLLNTLSSFSNEESHQLFLESWYVTENYLKHAQT